MGVLPIAFVPRFVLFSACCQVRQCCNFTVFGVLRVIAKAAVRAQYHCAAGFRSCVGVPSLGGALAVSPVCLLRERSRECAVSVIIWGILCVIVTPTGSVSTMCVHSAANSHTALLEVQPVVQLLLQGVGSCTGASNWHGLQLRHVHSPAAALHAQHWPCSHARSVH